MRDFRIQAGALRAAVARCAGVATRSGTIPIVAHLHMTARANTLTLRATNLDIEMASTAAGDGDLPELTASAARLQALLAFLPAEETVTLSQAKEGQLCLNADRFSARLFTMPAEDFPDWEAPGARPHTITLPAAGLLRLLDRTAYAVSTEETRYYLNGIYLHRGNGVLRAVSTDGHRLALAEEPWPEEATGLDSVILPRHAAALLRAELRRLPPEAPITWRAGATRGDFIARGWTLRVKMIDGIFPDYERVIPEAEGAPILVSDPAALSRHIAAVASISDERSTPVQLGNGSGRDLALLARGPELGECSLTVPAEIAAWGTDEAHPAFAVQARYMREVCGVFVGGMTLRVIDDTAPIHISGPAGTAVLMPMRF